jgi:hypothetical protein
VMFSNIRSKAELPLRLRLFQEVRRKRVGAIQVFSGYGADCAETMAEEASLWVQPVPSKSVSQSLVAISSLWSVLACYWGKALGKGYNAW